MKIGASETLPELPRTPAAKTPSPQPVQDRHSITAGSLVGAAKQSVEDVRGARIQELAAQIKSGQYQPNAQQIANAILDAALVDAQLEAAG